MAQPKERTHVMAVFCDFENVALGAHDANFDKFDINKVLERLLLRGLIVVKKAYCDWERYRSFKKSMHEAAFELIEIPHVRQSGKNSADIRMVVDALDLCYTKEHVDTFVIVSGDSDFSPLVSKLRENNKTVIGLGVKNSTSDLFKDNCDDFIFYDDLVRGQRSKLPPRRQPGTTSPAAKKSAASSAANGTASAPPPSTATAAPATAAAPLSTPDAPAEGPKNVQKSGDPEKAMQMVLETADGIWDDRDSMEPLWSSHVKQTLKRRFAGFNEKFFGFASFKGLLEAMRERGLIELRRDEKSGDYQISRVGEAPDAAG